MNVNTIHNILSNNTLEKILEHNLKIFSKEPLKSSLSFWKDRIVEYSNNVSIYNLPKESLEYNLIKSDIYKNYNLKYDIGGIMYYYWESGSYIPWHSDGGYGNALTIYLNKEWDYKWGGLFQYYDDGIKTIIPESNLGVLQTGHVNHSTTITNKDTPIRKTIQIFFSNEIIKNQSIL
jgi:hypothetical protein